MIAPPALPIPLTDLAIKDSGVVSSILLKTDGGSVTQFAFVAGEGLREHATPREALIILTHGMADVTLEGTTHRLASGEVIRLPATVPHSVHAPGAMRMLLVTLTV